MALPLYYIYKKNKFYLHIAVKKAVADVILDTTSNIVGVDFGMNFLAVASDSNNKTIFFKGRHIKKVKANYVRLRKELQSKGTKSAKRKLKHIAGRENRFMTNVNHCVSKALVQFAGENSLVAIEDLTGINLSCSVYKGLRYYRLSWAFAQLRQFVEYKAKLNSSQVVAFNPKYTSQKCPKCGHIHKSNRDYKNHIFSCQQCRYASNDDRIGSLNLYQKGIGYLNKQSLSA